MRMRLASFGLFFLIIAGSGAAQEAQNRDALDLSVDVEFPNACPFAEYTVNVSCTAYNTPGVCYPGLTEIASGQSNLVFAPELEARPSERVQLGTGNLPTKRVDVNLTGSALFCATSVTCLATAEAQVTGAYPNASNSAAMNSSFSRACQRWSQESSTFRISGSAQ